MDNTCHRRLDKLTAINAARKVERIAAYCRNCGEPIKPLRESDLRHGKGQFCSRSCRMKFTRKRGKLAGKPAG